MELTAVRGLYLEEMEDMDLLMDDYVAGFIIGVEVGLLIVGIAC
jgi:hypothetical protein